MDCFKIVNPTANQVPILLSVPHCGTAFPSELQSEYHSGLTQAPDDTDWFVDRLYDFSASMGITLISAVYSRWVIDLNRDPKNQKLYSDGRLATGLCPVTNFFGEPIYRDRRKELTEAEVQRRLKAYYLPYHHKVGELLDSLKARFGKVLLWDCHSIRQSVPAIHKEKLPDLILSDADGTSAVSDLTETAYRPLTSSKYTVSRNFPFKGGYITRHFGKPALHQHALQLEMSKIVYMDDDEKEYVQARAEAVRMVLKNTLNSLIQKLN